MVLATVLFLSYCIYPVRHSATTRPFYIGILAFVHCESNLSHSKTYQTRHSELVPIEFDTFLKFPTYTTPTISVRQPPRIPAPLRAVSIFAGPRSLARGRAGSQSVCSMKRLGEGVDEEFVVGWLTGWRGGASGEMRMGFGIV